MTKKELKSEDKEKIIELRKKFAILNGQFGDLEFAKINMKKRKEMLVNEYINLQHEEVEISNYLKENYGEGTINLDSGEFIPKEK